MFKKDTKLYSILKGKCPRCREGDFFKFDFNYLPYKMAKLHKNCAHCNLKYMLEPSFYYGAMYVNYGITVGISIVVFLISAFIFNFTLLQCFLIIVIALFVLIPVNLRLSRILWIHLFVAYQKPIKEKK